MANVKIADIPTTETSLSNVIYVEGERSSNVPVKIPGSLFGSGLARVSLGVMPALSGFTQDNISGSRSVVESAGKAITVIEGSPSSGPKVIGIRKAVPASTPYRVAAFIQNNSNFRNYMGMCFGWSDGTKHHVLSSFSIEMYSFSNSNTRAAFGGSLASAAALPPSGIWVGMMDDGTNVYFEQSGDGVNFCPIFTTSKASGYLGSSGYSQTFLGLYSEASAVSGSSYPHSMSILTYDESGLTRVFS